MRDAALEKLEYRQVIEIVSKYAVTYLGKKRVGEMRPQTGLSVIARQLEETLEASRLLAGGGHPPLPSLEGMEEIMPLLGTGYVLSEDNFGHLARFIRSCEQLAQYMASKKAAAPSVAAYATSMFDLKPLRLAIETSIDRGRIVDTASADLHKVRKKIRIADEKLHKRLHSLMSTFADALQEKLVSQRDGRYVLPVKKEMRRRVPGAVLDESASGQTVFVEPAELAGLQMALGALRVEETREELQVLARLTAEAETYGNELSVNVETTGHYDFLFAKARWGAAIGGTAPLLNAQGVVDLRGARHPLLAEQPVPLDLKLGEGYRALLITGPNTGGKTVALKTVGLLTLMAQSGLLVPAEAGSRMGVFRAVEADIGDGQSLASSLSTFSAHLRSITDILATADGATLVLLDELATGTDPGEGVGLSIAVLEDLYRRGATIVATTHYNEIKAFAGKTPGFRNARMAFDEQTLRPLYRLEIGEWGSSFAFVIAGKLGMPQRIVDRAREISAQLVGNRPGGADGAGPGGPPELSALPATGDIPAGGPVGNTAPGAGGGIAGTHTRTARAEGAFERKRADRPEAEETSEPEWQVGDAVFVPSLGKRGIVFKLPDERGNLIVQVRGAKLKLNRKRIKPFIKREQLYPGADYDLDIVFESVENRKKRKKMGRKHIEGLTIETPAEESDPR